MRQVFLLLGLFASVCNAVPQITSGPLNAASYAGPSGTGGGVARGSIFVLFGNDLGPTVLAQAPAYPLMGSLAGARVTVRAGGALKDCLLLYAYARQVAAILPSDLPAGPATMTASFSGQTSATVDFQIVDANPGLFTMSQTGTGQAVAQQASTDGSLTLIERDTPVKRGATLVLWGTGLGPINADESMPVPGPIGKWDIIVGNTTSPATYSGRSGCCSGVDQIVFTIPASAPSGCRVPLFLRSGAIVSNALYLSISDSPACTEPFPTPSEVTAALGQGRIKYLEGYVANLLATTTTPLTQAGKVLTFVNGMAATFNGGYVRSYVRPARLASVFTSAGDSCAVTRVRNDDAVAATTALTDSSTFLDTAGHPVAAVIRETGTVAPGEYSFIWRADSNAGPYAAYVQMPPPIAWTNSNLSSFRRDAPLDLLWTGGQKSLYVVADIIYADFTDQIMINCKTLAVNGKLSIPPSVLQQLPANSSVSVSIMTLAPPIVRIGQPAGIDLSFVIAAFQVGPTFGIRVQ